MGVPAIQIGRISEYGEHLDLPLSGNATANCPNTIAHYLLSGDTLFKAIRNSRSMPPFGAL
jgi:UDP-2-acetamido-3-amino-2,3-dideoxy-glucuronate N-acetyltransferase